MRYYLYLCFSFVLGGKNKRFVKLKIIIIIITTLGVKLSLVDSHTYTGDLNGRAHIL